MLLTLALTVTSNAGEGYDREGDILSITRDAATIKVGQVVRINEGSRDFDYIRDSTDTMAVVFFHRRGYAPKNELTFRVTVRQRSHVEVSAKVYLRRTADGWEYLGSQVGRDPQGKTVWRY